MWKEKESSGKCPQYSQALGRVKSGTECVLLGSVAFLSVVVSGQHRTNVSGPSFCAEAVGYYLPLNNGSLKE